MQAIFQGFSRDVACRARSKVGEGMSLNGAEESGWNGHPPVLGGNLQPSFGRRAYEPNGVSQAYAERRASRPPQPAGGRFHPDLDRIVAADTKWG